MIYINKFIVFFDVKLVVYDVYVECHICIHSLYCYHRVLANFRHVLDVIGGSELLSAIALIGCVCY